MNDVKLFGRLTRDPDIRYNGQGQDAMCMARFTLAVDRPPKKDGTKETDFINCIAFGVTASVMEKYVHQGTKIITTRARIQTGSYTNKDGQKVYTTDVLVQDFEFAESKSANGNSNTSAQPAQPAQTLDNTPTTPSNVGQGFMNIPEGLDDDGLPF